MSIGKIKIKNIPKNIPRNYPMLTLSKKGNMAPVMFSVDFPSYFIFQIFIFISIDIILSDMVLSC